MSDRAASGTIAFLGLGHMGGPMAANLIKAGHGVLGYDPVPAAVEAAKAHGIPMAASAAEAVTGARGALPQVHGEVRRSRRAPPVPDHEDLRVTRAGVVERAEHGVDLPRREGRQGALEIVEVLADEGDRHGLSR